MASFVTFWVVFLQFSYPFYTQNGRPIIWCLLHTFWLQKGPGSNKRKLNKTVVVARLLQTR